MTDTEQITCTHGATLVGGFLGPIQHDATGGWPGDDHTCDDIAAVAAKATQVEATLADEAANRAGRARQPLRITGQLAADIRSLTASITPTIGWTEVQVLDECDYSCKLHVRTVDDTTEYALIHSATYGCPLGRDEATAVVPIEFVAIDSEPTLDVFRDCDTAELVRQIGFNIWAVSGGRVQRRETGITLPVDCGYRVTVDLAADDTYTVRRIFVRKGVTSVKGEMTGVYCDEVSEVAYRASCFRNVAFPAERRCQWDMPDGEQPDSVQCPDTSMDDNVLCEAHADLNYNLAAAADAASGR